MISIANLSKRYGAVHAVRDVTFSCSPGTITGFLGANGAGKSTTLRMLTGLTRPDTGSATIDGKAFTSLSNPARTVGVMLDSSALHVGRTGRETLRVAAMIAGVPAGRADELLSATGLAGAARRRVGTYSLGMRQRLGLALALLGSPSVLILDEPANGLDPEGIAWIRGLLREHAARGGTVLLSSHLLAEVQATADRLVIIAAGRIVAQGTLGQLLGESGQSLEEKFLSLTAGAAGTPSAGGSR
jgi:ABC-2 type transport system ATP-binding protein